MSFKRGAFDRTRAGVFHPFCPAHAVFSLIDVDLKDLWSRGKRLILLDVDHTLVMWKQEEFSPEVIHWLDQAKEMGFDLCIISNTRRVERLGRLTRKLGIETVRGKFKPSTSMYLLALEKFKKDKDQAIMIGDQIMTDVLGANRAGIESIWVQKMQGPEFVGTKINRFVEKILTGVIYRAIIAPIDEQPAPVEIRTQLPFWERAIFRQLIKFGIVGVSSFVIDWIIRSSMQTRISMNGELISQSAGRWILTQFPKLGVYFAEPKDAFLPVSILVAAAVATFNSFLWNRAWTFQVKNPEERSRQLRRVYLVAYSAILINMVVTSVLHSRLGFGLFVSTVCATILAAAWNFIGQRTYAFRVK